MPFARAVLAPAIAALMLTTPLALSAQETAPAAEAPAADPATVVATVNGENITLGDLILLRATLDPQRIASLPPTELYDNLVEQSTNKILLRQAAERAGMQDRRTVKQWLNFQRNAVLADVYANERVSEQISEELIAAEYEKRFANVEGPKEWSANHILVQDEAEAAALAQRAKSGEDFEQLAKDNSKGPSAPQGGALGWFRAGQLVLEFQSTVETLSPGDVSDPVQTEFGWHVIKLNDVRSAPPPPIQQVQRELAELLTAQITESVIEALRDSGEVSTVEGQPGIDDLGNISLITEE